jgi:hypothetical protein
MLNKPSRMKPFYVVFAASVLDTDLLYTVWHVPCIAICRADQTDNACKVLGLPPLMAGASVSGGGHAAPQPAPPAPAQSAGGGGDNDGLLVLDGWRHDAQLLGAQMPPQQQLAYAAAPHGSGAHLHLSGGGVALSPVGSAANGGDFAAAGAPVPAQRAQPSAGGLMLPQSSGPGLADSIVSGGAPHWTSSGGGTAAATPTLSQQAAEDQQELLRIWQQQRLDCSDSEDGLGPMMAGTAAAAQRMGGGAAGRQLQGGNPWMHPQQLQAQQQQGGWQQQQGGWQQQQMLPQQLVPMQIAPQQMVIPITVQRPLPQQLPNQQQRQPQQGQQLWLSQPPPQQQQQPQQRQQQSPPATAAAAAPNTAGSSPSSSPAVTTSGNCDLLGATPSVTPRVTLPPAASVQSVPRPPSRRALRALLQQSYQQLHLARQLSEDDLATLERMAGFTQEDDAAMTNGDDATNGRPAGAAVAAAALEAALLQPEWEYFLAGWVQTLGLLRLIHKVGGDGRI